MGPKWKMCSNREMNVTCQWNGCFQRMSVENIQDHISNHVGFRRNATFDGDCKWIHMGGHSDIPNSPKECAYKGSSRHLLLSHVRKHIETLPFTCDLCKKSSYKWSHDLLKHKRKCKQQIFDNLVNILFEGAPLNSP